MPPATSADPRRVLAVVQGLDVQRNAAYFARDGLTFCNDYVNAVTAGCGHPVPPLLANEQHDWLDGDEGRAAGWRKLTDDAEGTAVEKARTLAEAGELVVASWKNPTGGHGHIGVCVPAPDLDAGHLYVSAAGAQNWMRARLEKSFGLNLHPDFFVNLQDRSGTQPALAGVGVAPEEQ